MVKRRVYDDEKHIHFITFSCYKRRRYLQTDIAKRIVIGHLGSRLQMHGGICLGFVIMTDHVRAGLVEHPTQWQWSSASWYLEGRSVGLPIRWPPGLESDG